jgi:mRNA interferase RelE/StbE
MYSVIFSKKAEEQLYKLNEELQKRIVNHLERIKIRPYHFVEKIVNAPYFKLRVGDYRLILEINNKELLIFVIKVGHRKNVHKM